jgi:hypothetical protein
VTAELFFRFGLLDVVLVDPLPLPKNTHIGMGPSLRVLAADMALLSINISIQCIALHFSLHFDLIFDL